MSEDDGTRVESQTWGYTLRYGRRIEYASPLVSRVSRSPAHDGVNFVKATNRLEGDSPLVP